MVETPASAAPRRPRPHRSASVALVALALATGVLGIGAAWTLFNAYSGNDNGWVALVAAADAALLLRLAGMRAGAARALLGVTAVAATVLVAAWMGAALKVGAALGLRPMESAVRMGPELAWTLSGAGAAPLDTLAVLAALPLAWWWCR